MHAPPEWKVPSALRCGVLAYDLNDMRVIKCEYGPFLAATLDPSPVPAPSAAASDAPCHAAVMFSRWLVLSLMDIRLRGEKIESKNATYPAKSSNV